jgi:hypothetical protein
VLRGQKIQNSQLSGPSVTTAVMKRTNESLAKNKWCKNVQLSGPSVTTAVMKRTNVSENFTFNQKLPNIQSNGLDEHGCKKFNHPFNQKKWRVKC